jgi:hypothetical protein
MSKAPRWRDSDDDYADELPTPSRPLIDVPRLKRKLASKPSEARTPENPADRNEPLNKLGRPMQSGLIWSEYPDED